MKFTYRHTMYTCYFASVTSAIINTYAPLLFITFQNEFNITIDKIALLVTLNFAVQMCVDFSGAYYAERLGYRKTVVLAQLFSVTGFVCYGILPYLFSNSFAGLVISTVLCAVGSGLIEVMVSPIIEALPSEAKASSMSILHSFYCWGYACVVMLSTLFFNIFGINNWRVLTILWAIIPFVTMVMYLFVPINTLPKNKHKSPVKHLFKKKVFWILFVIMLCSGAAEMGISQWVSMFVETGLGLPKSISDLLGPFVFAVLMGVARMFYGKAGEKISLEKYIFFCGGLCTISYFIITIFTNPVVSLIGCGLCGLSVAIMWPGTLSLSASYCKTGGTAMFGLLALGGDIGCFLGPQVVAWVSGEFSIYNSPLRAGLLVAAVFPLVIMILISLIKNIKKA